MIDLIFGLAYIVVILIGVTIGVAAVFATYLIWYAFRVFRGLRTSMKEPVADDGY